MAPLTVAGLSIYTWWDAWKNCHAYLQGGWMQTAWPDGRCYAEQPHHVVEIFEWITSEMYRIQASSSH